MPAVDMLVWYVYLTFLLFIFFIFYKGSPPLFLGVAQTCKKESFFVYADNTDSMNDDMK